MGLADVDASPITNTESMRAYERYICKDHIFFGPLRAGSLTVKNEPIR